MADELVWKWHWWWDPFEEHLKVLDPGLQRQVLAVKLEAHAQQLKIQAEALTKVSGLIGGARQAAAGKQP